MPGEVLVIYLGDDSPASALVKVASQAASTFAPQTIDHRKAVSEFFHETTSEKTAPTNAMVLGLVSALRQPVGALFEGDTFLDKVAWAALGYYQPGDKFKLDAAWLSRPYDNPVSLQLMMNAWAARQPRTWMINPRLIQPIVQMDASAIRREAEFWWERLKAARSAGREGMPPGATTDVSSLTVLPSSLQPRPLPSPVFWVALAAFVAAGIGAAVVVARRR